MVMFCSLVDFPSHPYSFAASAATECEDLLDAVPLPPKRPRTLQATVSDVSARMQFGDSQPPELPDSQETVMMGDEPVLSDSLHEDGSPVIWHELFSHHHSHC